MAAVGNWQSPRGKVDTTGLHKTAVTYVITDLADFCCLKMASDVFSGKTLADSRFPKKNHIGMILIDPRPNKILTLKTMPDFNQNPIKVCQIVKFTNLMDIWGTWAVVSTKHFIFTYASKKQQSDGGPKAAAVGCLANEANDILSSRGKVCRCANLFLKIFPSAESLSSYPSGPVD